MLRADVLRIVFALVTTLTSMTAAAADACPTLLDRSIPGLLDGKGWQYRNRSAAIVPEIAFRGQPDRFGGPDDRRKVKHSGASDHFPVVIELIVNK